MSYLDDLLASTRDRVAEARSKVTEDVLEQRIAGAEPPRGFTRALAGPDVALVAEIKRASPSKGPLAPDLDAAKTATAFREGGAAAISVLTEPGSFLGSLEDMRAASTASLPVLRKDFIVDPWQVFESWAEGADAVLVIVKAAGDQTTELVRATEALGMDALVEVHDESELDLALAAGASLVGVNHRNLDTFEVDPERTAKLAGLMPQGITVVALSGVTTRAEVEELARAGAHAVLVGESLVTAPDPRAKVAELLRPL